MNSSISTDPDWSSSISWNNSSSSSPLTCTPKFRNTYATYSFDSILVVGLHTCLNSFLNSSNKSSADNISFFSMSLTMIENS